MTKERFIHFLSFLLIIVFCIFLLINYNHFSLPDSDYLAYVWEGIDLLHLKTDVKYKYGPLFSLIVAIPTLLFPHLFEFSFYHISVLNIILMGLSLFLFVKMFYKKLQIFILPILIALFTNYVVLYSALQPLNFTFFLFLILLTFFLEHTGRITKAILTSFFSYFVRPEGVILFLIINVLHWRKITKNKKQLVTTIGLLTIIVAFQFMNRIFVFSDKEDSYIQEIIVRKNEIPNFHYLTQSFEQYFLNLGTILENKIYWFVIIYLVIGFKFIYADGSKKWRSVYIFLIIYSVLHTFFLDPAFRYSLINIFLQYPFLFWPLFIIKKENIIYKNRMVASKIVAILVCISLFHTFQSSYTQFEFNKNHRAYLREIADSLNSGSKTAVIMYEPWVLFYFIRNAEVIYLLPPDYCDEISCMKEQINHYLADHYTVLILKESFSFVDTNYHFFKKNGGKMFIDLPKKDDPFTYTLLDTININSDKWVKIYQISTEI